MRPRLIKSPSGHLCLLSTEERQPSPDWVAMQAIRPQETGRWFSAIVVSGGALSVQETAWEDLGEASNLDISTAISNANFHGRDMIINLLLI